MSLMTHARKYGSQLVVGATAMAISVASFAAAVEIDTTEATDQIAKGSGAAVPIGIAFIAFCALIGVLVKTRRAGS